MANKTIDVTFGTTKLMPKWKLYLSIAIVLFIAVICAAFFFFRNNIFKTLINPRIPFQVISEPHKPDYRKIDSWLLFPQQNAQQDENKTNNKAAVFYVHPTTYYSGKLGWNTEITNGDNRKILDELVIPNHIAPFAKDNDIYAPLYRQATLSATLSFNDDAAEALTLAYDDVKDAFNYFINKIPKEQKIVLAGYNQGALHLSHLLQDLPPDLKQRIIAVYLIDQAIPNSVYNSSKNKNLLGALDICSNPRQNHCIINYYIVSRTNKRNIFLSRKYAPVYDNLNGYYKRGKLETLCTNPLNGGSAQYADEKLNTGAVAAANLENGAEPALLPGASDAKCDGGLLLVDGHRAIVLTPPKLELGTFYKVPRYNLFYNNLFEDLQNRKSNNK